MERPDIVEGLLIKVTMEEVVVGIIIRRLITHQVIHIATLEVQRIFMLILLVIIILTTTILQDTTRTHMFQPDLQEEALLVFYCVCLALYSLFAWQYVQMLHMNKVITMREVSQELSRNITVDHLLNMTTTCNLREALAMPKVANQVSHSATKTTR